MACPPRFKERVIVVKPLPVCARGLPRTSPHNGISRSFTTNSLFSVAWTGEDREGDSEEERKGGKASGGKDLPIREAWPFRRKEGQKFSTSWQAIGTPGKIR